jgi:protein involved in temperature-dependent protein secretion
MSAQEMIAGLSKLKPAELQRLKEKLRIEEARRLQFAAKEQPEYSADAKPIWEIAEQIGIAVPDEEWEKVPKDGSINVDHYLYGHPKSS